VGDYLKAIWELSREGAASTKDIADRLSISSASVSNMFVRLQEMGLAEYERYQGASLTEAGRVEALRLLRRHRLIETFLLKCLNYSWEDVHEEAESLEHSVSDGFTERLAEFLGHPPTTRTATPYRQRMVAWSPTTPSLSRRLQLGSWYASTGWATRRLRSLPTWRSTV
jgi:Mn-dependent DtxR family transcriptional regulator